ncbi:hypothetical protein HDU76_005567, partial [Blyttiomyces sp. JEL0837]
LQRPKIFKLGIPPYINPRLYTKVSVKLVMMGVRDEKPPTIPFRELVFEKRWFEGGDITESDEVAADTDNVGQLNYHQTLVTEKDYLDPKSSHEFAISKSNLKGMVFLFLFGFEDPLKERAFLTTWLFPSMRLPAVWLSSLLIVQLGFAYDYDVSNLPLIKSKMYIYNISIILLALGFFLGAVLSWFRLMNYTMEPYVIAFGIAQGLVNSFDFFIDFYNVEGRKPYSWISLLVGVIYTAGCYGLRLKYAILTCCTYVLIAFIFCGSYTVAEALTAEFPLILAVFWALRAAGKGEMLLRRKQVFLEAEMLQEEIRSLKKMQEKADEILAWNLPIFVIDQLKENGNDFDKMTRLVHDASICFLEVLNLDVIAEKALSRVDSTRPVGLHRTISQPSSLREELVKLSSEEMVSADATLSRLPTFKEEHKSQWRVDINSSRESHIDRQTLNEELAGIIEERLQQSTKDQNGVQPREKITIQSIFAQITKPPMVSSSQVAKMMKWPSLRFRSQEMENEYQFFLVNSCSDGFLLHICLVITTVATFFIFSVCMMTMSNLATQPPVGGIRPTCYAAANIIAAVVFLVILRMTYVRAKSAIFKKVSEDGRHDFITARRQITVAYLVYMVIMLLLSTSVFLIICSYSLEVDYQYELTMSILLPFAFGSTTAVPYRFIVAPAVFTPPIINHIIGYLVLNGFATIRAVLLELVCMAIFAVLIYKQERIARDSFVVSLASKRAQALSKTELKKSELILKNTLSDKITPILKRNPEAGLLHFVEDGAVLALDIVGFTSLSSTLTAHEVVLMLNTLFLDFDTFCAAENVEKICTIGDAYIATGGLPAPIPNPTLAICRLALHMQLCVRQMDLNMILSRHPSDEQRLPQIQARIGIFSGPLYGALIGGKTKLKYDLIGDALDLAVELEQNSIPGRIHISRSTFHAISGSGATIIPRGGGFTLRNEETFILVKLGDLSTQN